jgi:predicted RNase H-like nuclease (RuvC/YqgF family)
MKEGDKKKWKCPNCRKTKHDPPQVTAEELRSFMKDISFQMKELLGLKPQITTLQKTVDSLEASVQHMSDNYDSILEKLEEKSAKVESLEKNVQELEEVIFSLHIRQRDSEQYARNRNIEISNIDVTQGENLVQIMDKLASKLQIDHSAEDIDVLHRVPHRGPSNAPAKIIVQFKSRTKRDVWLQRKQHGILSSDVVANSSGRRIFINEHLCPEWKKLLWQAKSMGKPKGYNMVWYKGGKILVKRNLSDTNVITISSMKDLAKLI